MKNRNAAERSAIPLRKILGKLWINRLQKRSHKRYLQRGPNNRPLVPDITTYTNKNKKNASQQLDMFTADRGGTRKGGEKDKH